MSTRTGLRGSIGRSLLVTLVVAVAVTTAAGGASVGAGIAPRPQAPPPAQRVFMVSDSVGLGAKSAMVNAFPADWQVYVTGKPALFVEQLVEQYVKYQPASVFGDYAIVAGGYNYPYWDPPRFDRSIDLMVNTLRAKGVKHVFWVTMREVTPTYFSGWSSLSSAYKTLYLAYPTANNQLRNAQLRHPELSIIDWAAVADQTGLTYDAIHLNTTGAARYSSLSANLVRTAATRHPAGTVTEIAVAGQAGAPADATAAVVSLTVANPRLTGYLTAFPCGGVMPVVSNVNFRPGQVVASTAVVPLGVGGKICVYQSAGAHVIVDLNGVFGATSGFLPLTPTRALDSRSSTAVAPASTVTVHLGDVAGTPEGAFTAVVNLTAIGNGTGGDVTIYTCGTTPPATPSRSVETGRVQNVPLIVTTDANGDVCVKVSTTMHVLVDLFGAFPADADVHPFATQHVLDTRFTTMAGAGAVLVQQVAGVAGVPATPLPSGAWLTVTLTSPQNIGWATAYPCAAGMPATSLLNVVPNHRQTNAGLVPVDANGQVCVFVSIPSHVLIDVNGWAGTAFTPLAPARLFDSRFD